MVSYFIKSSYRSDDFWIDKNDLVSEMLFETDTSAKKSFKQLLRWVKVSKSDQFSLVKIRFDKDGTAVVSKPLKPILVAKENQY